LKRPKRSGKASRVSDYLINPNFFISNTEVFVAAIKKNRGRSDV